MKYIVMLILAACLTSCRSDRDRQAELVALATATIEHFETEMEKAGEPTDLRVEAAIPKIPNVKFPTTQDEACETIGLPAIWMCGRYRIRPDGGFEWMTFDLTESYSISFKTTTNDYEQVFDLQIVKTEKPERK